VIFYSKLAIPSVSNTLLPVYTAW